jgi:hypothetical protein
VRWSRNGAIIDETIKWPREWPSRGHMSWLMMLIISSHCNQCIALSFLNNKSHGCQLCFTLALYLSAWTVSSFRVDLLRDERLIARREISYIMYIDHNTFTHLLTPPPLHSSFPRIAIG